MTKKKNNGDSKVAKELGVTDYIVGVDCGIDEIL